MKPKAKPFARYVRRLQARRPDLACDEIRAVLSTQFGEPDSIIVLDGRSLVTSHFLFKDGDETLVGELLPGGLVRYFDRATRLRARAQKRARKARRSPKGRFIKGGFPEGLTL